MILIIFFFFQDTEREDFVYKSNVFLKNMNMSGTKPFAEQYCNKYPNPLLFQPWVSNTSFFYNQHFNFHFEKSNNAVHSAVENYKN